MLALTPYVGKVVGRADGGAIAALELEQNMKGKRFQLVAEQGQTRLIQVDAEHIEVNNQSQSSSNQDTLASQTPSSLPPVSASGLSLLFGLFLLCIIGGLMATLISLQEKTKEDNGKFVFSFIRLNLLRPTLTIANRYQTPYNEQSSIINSDEFYTHTVRNPAGTYLAKHESSISHASAL